MWRRKLYTRISLVFFFCLVGLIIIFRSQLRDLKEINLQRLKIYADNFFFFSGPNVVRRMPLSVIETETELKLYIGQPFIDFSDKDWNDFWGIIYGARPMDDPEQPGLPKKARQLSRDEIANELASIYPQPFSYFKDEHWQMFFEIVLKNKK